MERGADRLSRPSEEGHAADGARWPDGARAAVSITFDNLGEAAEIELGLRDPLAPRGGHYSVTTALPIVLSELASAELRATFFVEGLNAEIYPDALRDIAAAGHELAYHAWCHEDWSALDPDAEAANLDHGLAALGALGIEVVGMRPPGGRLTDRTLALLRRCGLRYCSPAGSVAGVVLATGGAAEADRLAVLPFGWQSVDAFHILPAFAPLRQRLTGSAEPGGPAAVGEALPRCVEDAVASGGHAMLVLHTWLIELEREVVCDVLAGLRERVATGELWAAPCQEVAAWMAGERHPSLSVPPPLDSTSWTAPG